MKLIIKFAIIIILICFLNNSYNRKIKRRTLLFDYRDLAEQEDKKFPSPLTQPDAVENAKLQNSKSYKLLKRPNTVSKDMLMKTAASLLILFRDKYTDQIISDDIFRITKGGLLDDGNNSDSEKSKIINCLTNVSNGTGSAKENAAVLAILADLGSALVTVKVLKKNGSKASENHLLSMEYLAEVLKTNLDSLYKRVEAIYLERGITVIYPLKYKERSEGKLKKDSSKKYDEPRSGIFNLGNVDLKAKYTAEFLPNIFFEKCKTEPLTGHYSGTVFVTLFMFDLFLEQESTYSETSAIEISTTLIKSTKAIISDNSRVCRAALAAAELIAVGYHSAVEIKPVLWMYIGNSPPKTALIDLNKDNCDDKATEDITDVIENCTKKQNMK